MQVTMTNDGIFGHLRKNFSDWRVGRYDDARTLMLALVEAQVQAALQIMARILKLRHCDDPACPQPELPGHLQDPMAVVTLQLWDGVSTLPVHGGRGRRGVAVTWRNLVLKLIAQLPINVRDQQDPVEQHASDDVDSTSSESLDTDSSSSSSSSPCQATTARPGTVGARPPGPPDPLPNDRVTSVTATTTTSDESRVNLSIMGCDIALLVPVVLSVKDLTKCWGTVSKVLYGVLMVVSLLLTVTGFFTAWWPAVSWARRLSSMCARISLILASALFAIFICCKLGGFGCAAGVASAVGVTLILITVWIWSEQATDRAEPAAQEGASLPEV